MAHQCEISSTPAIQLDMSIIIITNNLLSVLGGIGHLFLRALYSLFYNMIGKKYVLWSMGVIKIKLDIGVFQGYNPSSFIAS